MMDIIKKQITEISPLVIKYKYHIIIVLTLIFTFIVYKSSCGSDNVENSEYFSNDELYSYKRLEKARYHHAELTSPDDALVSAIAKRYVNEDGTSDIEIVGDMYLLNKNVFGETTKQEYRATLSKDDEIIELGALEETPAQTYKLKKTVDVKAIDLDTITIFHVIYDKDGKPEPKLLLSGMFT